MSVPLSTDQGNKTRGLQNQGFYAVLIRSHLKLRFFGDSFHDGAEINPWVASLFASPCSESLPACPYWGIAMQQTANAGFTQVFGFLHRSSVKNEKRVLSSYWEAGQSLFWRRWPFLMFWTLHLSQAFTDWQHLERSHNTQNACANYKLIRTEVCVKCCVHINQERITCKLSHFKAKINHTLKQK